MGYRVPIADLTKKENFDKKEDAIGNLFSSGNQILGL